MVIINWLGLVMVLVAGGVGGWALRLFGVTHYDFTTMVCGILLIVIDLGYRSVRKTSLGWRGGGTFMLLPAWVAGVLSVFGSVGHMIHGR